MGENNIQKGAREVADLLKDGKTQEAGERLNDDFHKMPTDEFRKLVKQVDSYNADDRTTNKNLPDIEIRETSMENTTVVQSVDITTPGKVFGNMWRNSETVVDCRGGAGMIAHVDGLITGQRAELDRILNSMDRSSNEQAKPIEQRNN